MRIQRLKLFNFMTLRNAELNFNRDQISIINMHIDDNSSIYNALIWALSGSGASIHEESFPNIEQLAKIKFGCELTVSIEINIQEGIDREYVIKKELIGKRQSYRKFKIESSETKVTDKEGNPITEFVRISEDYVRYLFLSFPEYGKRLIEKNILESWPEYSSRQIIRQHCQAALRRIKQRKDKYDCPTLALQVQKLQERIEQKEDENRKLYEYLQARMDIWEKIKNVSKALLSSEKYKPLLDLPNEIETIKGRIDANLKDIERFIYERNNVQEKLKGPKQPDKEAIINYLNAFLDWCNDMDELDKKDAFTCIEQNANAIRAAMKIGRSYLDIHEMIDEQIEWKRALNFIILMLACRDTLSKKIDKQLSFMPLVIYGTLSRLGHEEMVKVIQYLNRINSQVIIIDSFDTDSVGVLKKYGKIISVKQEEDV